MSKHIMPTGLSKGGKGQRLWKDITGKWDLTEAEYRYLENACFAADRIAKERRIIGDDYTVDGSQGQMVAHPLLPELRRDEKHMTELLNHIDMPEEQEQSDTGNADGNRSARMRLVANSRWHEAYGS